MMRDFKCTVCYEQLFPRKSRPDRVVSYFDCKIGDVQKKLRHVFHEKCISSLQRCPSPFCSAVRLPLSSRHTLQAKQLKIASYVYEDDTKLTNPHTIVYKILDDSAANDGEEELPEILYVSVQKKSAGAGAASCSPQRGKRRKQIARIATPADLERIATGGRKNCPLALVINRAATTRPRELETLSEFMLNTFGSGSDDERSSTLEEDSRRAVEIVDRQLASLNAAKQQMDEKQVSEYSMKINKLAMDCFGIMKDKVKEFIKSDNSFNVQVKPSYIAPIKDAIKNMQRIKKEVCGYLNFIVFKDFRDDFNFKLIVSRILMIHQNIDLAQRILKKTEDVCADSTGQQFYRDYVFFGAVFMTILNFSRVDFDFFLQKYPSMAQSYNIELFIAGSFFRLYYFVLEDFEVSVCHLKNSLSELQVLQKFVFGSYQTISKVEQGPGVVEFFHPKERPDIASKMNDTVIAHLIVDELFEHVHRLQTKQISNEEDDLDCIMLRKIHMNYDRSSLCSICEKPLVENSEFLSVPYCCHMESANFHVFHKNCVKFTDKLHYVPIDPLPMAVCSWDDNDYVLNTLHVRCPVCQAPHRRGISTDPRKNVFSFLSENLREACSRPSKDEMSSREEDIEEGSEEGEGSCEEDAEEGSEEGQGSREEDAEEGSEEGQGSREEDTRMSDEERMSEASEDRPRTPVEQAAGAAGEVDAGGAAGEENFIDLMLKTLPTSKRKAVRAHYEVMKKIRSLTLVTLDSTSEDFHSQNTYRLYHNYFCELANYVCLIRGDTIEFELEGYKVAATPDALKDILVQNREAKRVTSPSHLVDFAYLDKLTQDVIEGRRHEEVMKWVEKNYATGLPPWTRIARTDGQAAAQGGAAGAGAN